MKLIEKIQQYRRDFKGIYECESCGAKEIHNGYDDDNFHDNVTPNWKCDKCGKSSKELGIENKISTIYAPREVI